MDLLLLFVVKCLLQKLCMLIGFYYNLLPLRDLLFMRSYDLKRNLSDVDYLWIGFEATQLPDGACLIDFRFRTVPTDSYTVFFCFCFLTLLKSQTSDENFGESSFKEVKHH